MTSLKEENAALRDMLAALRQENEALYDIFAAIGESSADSNWIIGYVQGIKSARTSALRAYAADIRAKDAPPLPHDPAAPRCDSERVTPGNPLLQCSLEQDHPGRHAAYTPTGAFIVAWDDEPDPPDPDACKCGHAGYQHVYTGHEPCTQCECKAFTAAPSGGVMFGPFSETAASLA